MNREILFRGKRTDNGEWVYGSLVKMGPAGYTHYFILPDYASAFYDIEVDPNSIGQYTGMDDKNGVKIFEGDILAGSCGGKSTEYFEVWWSEASCGFVAGRGERMRPNMNQATVGRYEIAGNIHDGQEIL